MTKAESLELSSNVYVEEQRTFPPKTAIVDRFLLIIGELLALISLFLPWFSIKMSVPLMGVWMNGTYDFYLYNKMRVSIEGLPGAFAGAIASEETMLSNIHLIFWFPLLGVIVGLWPLMKLFRRKSYHKEALVSSALIILIGIIMKSPSVTHGIGTLNDFIGLMESVGAELSFSSLGSDIFLISGILMLFSQLYGSVRRAVP